MIVYFANPTSSPAVHAAMADGLIGFIDTPRQGNHRPAGIAWCADNGCFGSSFDETHWWEWLQRNAASADECVFATAPDVVGDANATLERSLPWLPRIRSLGYPAALVAQDGQLPELTPWGAFDVLFIGGSTEWKLGAEARTLVAEAKRRGKYVHMGRVNSGSRLSYAAAIGCDSADGTFLKFGPNVNLPRLLRWLRINEQPALW